jgi:hypothetical protein
MTEDQLQRLIARRSFCTLATTSSAGRAHVAGVLYVADGTTLYVNTLRTSRKARNLAANPRASVCIPVRRLPFGPPSSIQFAATAELLDVDDAGIRSLLAAGTLKPITSHGELDLPDDCFVRLTPALLVTTYGLGMPLRRLIRNPLDAGGAVDLGALAAAP